MAVRRTLKDRDEDFQSMSVRLAFIGAGGIAQWQHFDNVAEMDNADVVAICDVDEGTAREAADRFDAAVFTDYRDLYEEAALDAVFVCLPPFAHDGQEEAAAERGIDLFVEKPLALSNERARGIRDAIDANGVVAQVGYNWRYSRGIERARELLDGRTIGYVEGYWWGGPAGSEGHWWREKALSGGQTVEQSTHVFDSIRYLAGDVERVTASGANRIVDEVDFSDVSSATMEHETGVVSHVSTSCAAEAGKVGLEIIADGATLEVNQHGLSGTVDGEEVKEEYDHDPYAAEVEAFLAAAESGDDSAIRAPYADSVKSLALTLSVNDSIDTGETVIPGGE